MMFTTEQSHRIFLTVLLLLLGVIGKRPEVRAGTTIVPTLAPVPTISAVAATTRDNDKNRESDEEQRLFKSILSSKPNSFTDDYHNNHDHDHDPALRSFPNPKYVNVKRPPSTVMIKANLPFSTDHAHEQDINHQHKHKAHDYTRRNGLVVNAPYPNNGNFFNCLFSKNCPMEIQDEWRNYYSVLNGLDKPDLNERYFNYRPLGTQTEFQTGISAAIPFIVDASSNVNNKDKNKFHSHNKDRGDDKEFFHRYSPSQASSNWPAPAHIRVTRTTTSSPSWVKLQPMPAHMYDPFPMTKNRSGGASHAKNAPSKFASRVGTEELSPETFADRYGWNKDSQQTLRIPAWLEELNYQHAFKGTDTSQGHRGPAYGNPFNGNGGGNNSPGDDDKGWVKLDPIPVSGVTISKWVPKGTSPAELPSTNWPVRDKPTAWWDRNDSGNSRDPPWADGPIRSPLLAASSNSFGSNRYPSNHNKKHHGVSHSHALGDSWSDIIYPDSPTSATASWESSKDGPSSASSSFPASWLSGAISNRDKYSGRPAVASWSAPGSSSGGGGNKAGASRFGHHRDRPTSSSSSSYGRPSFYPDPQAGPSDPRWVLVSTTGEASFKKPSYDRDRDRFSDRPYEHYSNRHSKDMNFTKLYHSTSTIPPTSTILTQDELFKRTNETLSLLSPYFSHRSGLLPTTEEPEPFRTFIPILEGDMDMMVLDADGKALNKRADSSRTLLKTTAAPAAALQSENQNKGFLHRINPVFAAVGAGMIPATLAAVLPAALGRKRKRRHTVQIYGKPVETSARQNRAVPNIILHDQQQSPMLLSSFAPSLYKFLKKPAKKTHNFG